MYFLQQLIQGIALGSIYGLVALGYVLIWQAWDVLNFAQGEMCAIGAFSLLVLHVECSLPIYVAFPLAVVISILVSFVIELIAFHPLMKATELNKLIATIGLSICLRNLLRVIFGADAYSFPSIFGDKPTNFYGLILVPQNIWNIVFGFSLVLLLNLFLKKTRTGKAMRATAQDREAARLMGIKVKKSLTGTFVIASTMGAVAGMLIAPIYLMMATMGESLGTKGFAAAVLGGINVASGAMVGGLILGVAECLAAGFVSSAYQSAIAYIILFLALILKPSGIMNRNKTVEKV